MYIHGQKFKIYKNKKHCSTFWEFVAQFLIAILVLFFGLGLIAGIFNLLF